MNYRMLLSAAVMIGAAGVLHAQAPAGAGTTREVTIAGCIERADQIPEAATTGATVDSQSFVLIEVPKEDAAAAQPTGTSSQGAGMPRSMYWLDADTSKLNPHVGHRVEVTGTLDRVSSAAGSAAPAAGGANAQSAAAARHVRVVNITMMSETCPALRGK